MATPLLVLPTELWDSIFISLVLPDLEAINLVSKYFQGMVQTRLQEHRNLFRQASKFESDDRYGVDRAAIPWLGPLCRVLRDPVAAFYIKELDIALEQTSSTLESYAEERAEWGREALLPPTADMDLVERAALTCMSDWFDDPEHPEYKSNFMADAKNGEQSAILAILMCHLPNLQTLTLTSGCWGGLEDAPWLVLLAKRVHLRPERALIGGRPFTRLQHIKGDIFNGFYGLDFESIADFIALPSVRWLEISQNHEEGFDWPDYLPQANVREILLNESSVSEEAITKFAATALRGPCLIRQVWRARRHDSTPDATWRRLEVPFEGAKAEDFIVEKEDEFIDPWDYNCKDMEWETKDKGT